MFPPKFPRSFPLELLGPTVMEYPVQSLNRKNLTQTEDLTELSAGPPNQAPFSSKQNRLLSKSVLMTAVLPKKNKVGN